VIDIDGDGRFDVLEVETRNFKGPRTFDSTGIPLHSDNKTVVRSASISTRTIADFSTTRSTTIDNALTRPWTVRKKYQRDPNPRPVWSRTFVAKATTT